MDSKQTCVAAVAQILLGSIGYLISKVDGVDIYRESSDYKKFKKSKKTYIDNSKKDS